jgi:hypothetical protein
VQRHHEDVAWNEREKAAHREVGSPHKRPFVIRRVFGRNPDRVTVLPYAISRTRLSCTSFRANEVRLQLHALAYNLANFLRTMALPRELFRAILDRIALLQLPDAVRC